MCPKSRPNGRNPLWPGGKTGIVGREFRFSATAWSIKSDEAGVMGFFTSLKKIFREDSMLTTLSRACLCGGTALALMLVALPTYAAWEPTKPVEIVVAAGAGGASD